jgi:hypothetical protein
VIIQKYNALIEDRVNYYYYIYIYINININENILKKKIKDKDLFNFILKMLTAGIIYLNKIKIL